MNEIYKGLKILLEDESQVNFYFRRALRIVLILYLALYLFIKTGGFIDFDIIYNGENLNIRGFLEELVSFKLLIPVLFIFVAHGIYSFLEWLVRLVIVAPLTYLIEKNFEKPLNDLKEVSNLDDLGIGNLKQLYLDFVSRYPSISNILELPEEAQIPSSLAKLNTESILKYKEDSEVDYYDKLDLYIEGFLVGIGLKWFIDSSYISFLDLNNWTGIITNSIVVLYLITRIPLLGLTIFRFRFQLMINKVSEVYLRLQSEDKNNLSSDSDKN